MFAWAVAIAPTKDNYWSTDTQTGSAYGDFATISEPYNRLQAAVSTVSKGPVAPSDKIGRSDTALILKSCMVDGQLLQGDKPAMQLDRLHVGKAFGTVDDMDQAWVTTTALSNEIAPHATLLGATLTAPLSVSLADLGLSANQNYVAYETNTSSTLKQLNGTSMIDLEVCGKWDFQLWSLAPLLANGWALLGEPSKWVSVSGKRFRDLEFDSTGDETSASVTVIGVEGENVEVAWFGPVGRSVVTCTIPRGSAVSVQVGSAIPSGRCVDV